MTKQNSSFSLPFFDFTTVVRTHARHRGQDMAFIEGDLSVDWKTFDRDTAQVAEALIRQNIGPGDRVALLSGNSYWAYRIAFGIIRAGGVVTPLSTLLPPTLLTKLIEDSGVRCLFASQLYEPLAAATMAQFKQISLFITETGEAPESQSFGDFISGCPGVFAGVPVNPDDLFTIIYSSGTTGIPKGIMHTHVSRVGLALQFGAAFAVTPRARSVIATPPSSNGSMMFLLPTLYAGATCILQHTLRPDDFYSLLETHKPTHTFLVPTQFKAIFEDKHIASADFSSLRCLLSAGAAMPAYLKKMVTEYCGHCYHELWGFTEGVATTIYPDEVESRLESVGRPLPGTEIRLINSEGGELKPPAMGEIVGRSTMMMPGYLNRPDANEEIGWQDENGNVFLRTGDIGEIDSEGFLTLRGRIKEMIVSGGLNVYPVDIESVMQVHPEIDDVAVVGISHDKWGEVPVAFVILKSGSASNSASLQDWTNQRVAKFQLLADLVICSQDFPRNALGKVLKGELRKKYQVSPQ